MAGLKSLSTLLGYMNNKAVALARCGNTDEAIELYNNTYESIPKDREDLVAIVKYNIALALVRADRFDEAQSVLKAVNQIKTSPVKQKAASLSLRLKRAIDDGASFELRSSTGAPESKGSQAKVPANDSQIVSPEDNAKLLAKIAAEPGDLCCYKIFHVRGETPAKVEAMLAKPPRFKRRDAIEREEALGAEKTSKAS
jgi:tetratricopeptide (TPR) repeat protein